MKYAKVFWLVSLTAILWSVAASQTRPTSPAVAIESGESKRMRLFALRLKPGQDLRSQIESFAKEKQIQARLAPEEQYVYSLCERNIHRSVRSEMLFVSDTSRSYWSAQTQALLKL